MLLPAVCSTHILIFPMISSMASFTVGLPTLHGHPKGMGWGTETLHVTQDLQSPRRE